MHANSLYQEPEGKRPLVRLKFGLVYIGIKMDSRKQQVRVWMEFKRLGLRSSGRLF
jgi:hypothetical protein